MKADSGIEVDYQELRASAYRWGKLCQPQMRKPPLALGILWISAFLAALVLAGGHQPGLDQKLDTGSILAIAGLNLVAVSVTFGVIGLQAQHFAETYTRVVSRTIEETQLWPWILGFQALSVLGSIAMALYWPTVGAGIASGVLLGVGLIESGLVLRELLGRYDGVRLLRLIGAGNIAYVNRRDGIEAASLIARAQAVLDLVIRGAEKGDTEVTAEGLNIWLSQLEAYLKRKGLLLFDDEYLAWTFARLQELIETYGRRSAGVVLPKLIQGTIDMGVVLARHPGGVNEGINEGVYSALRCLGAAVATSVDSHLSPAAASALIGITEIGEALIDAQKVNTAGEVARRLGGWGKTLTSRPDLAHWSCTGLARVILRLAGPFSAVHMAASSAEEATEGLVAILAEDRSDLGPTHFLTAPLSERSLPRLVYAAAVAAARERDRRHWSDWDRVAAQLAHLTFGLPLKDDLHSMVRMNAADCAADVLLALMTAPYRDATTKLFSDLVEEYRKLLWDGDVDRLHLAEGLGDVLLAAYYASRADSPANAIYRQFIQKVAETVSGCERQKRLRFAPALRLVGAAALHDGDDELGTAMAKASLPAPPRPAGRLYLEPDEFQPRMFPGSVSRPGVPEPHAGTAHEDTDARTRFLRLEAKVRRHDRG